MRRDNLNLSRQVKLGRAAEPAQSFGKERDSMNARRGISRILSSVIRVAPSFEQTVNFFRDGSIFQPNRGGKRALFSTLRPDAA